MFLFVDRLECKGNHIPHRIIWSWPQSDHAPPRCTKCDSPPINGQYTNHRLVV